MVISILLYMWSVVVYDQLNLIRNSCIWFGDFVWIRISYNVIFMQACNLEKNKHEYPSLILVMNYHETTMSDATVWSSYLYSFHYVSHTIYVCGLVKTWPFDITMLFYDARLPCILNTDCPCLKLDVKISEVPHLFPNPFSRGRVREGRGRPRFWTFVFLSCYCGYLICMCFHFFSPCLGMARNIDCCLLLVMHWHFGDRKGLLGFGWNSFIRPERQCLIIYNR